MLGVHIMACVRSTGQKKLSRIFHSSLTPLFPEIITDKCLLRLQHLAMSPSMPFRKQPRSWGLLTNTPSTVWTRPAESLRTKPTSFILRGPSQERWRSTEFCRARVSRQQETQISNNNGTPLTHKRRITGRTLNSTTTDGKTTIEALQFLTTCGAAPPQVPDLRTMREMDPWMSQSSFTNFDRTATTFKTKIRGPTSNLSGNTSDRQLTPDIL